MDRNTIMYIVCIGGSLLLGLIAYLIRYYRNSKAVREAAIRDSEWQHNLGGYQQHSGNSRFQSSYNNNAYELNSSPGGFEQQQQQQRRDWLRGQQQQEQEPWQPRGAWPQWGQGQPGQQHYRGAGQPPTTQHQQPSQGRQQARTHSNRQSDEGPSLYFIAVARIPLTEPNSSRNDLPPKYEDLNSSSRANF